MPGADIRSALRPLRRSPGFAEAWIPARQGLRLDPAGILRS
jgi:hypothetical protein